MSNIFITRKYNFYYTINMINEKQVRKYCKGNITKIENYDEAMSDTLQVWHCHHKFGLTKSAEELQRDNAYFDCVPEELIFLRGGKHSSLHATHRSAKTRKKLSDAAKRQKGRTRSKVSLPK